MKDRQKLRKGIILFSFFFFPATFYYLSPVAYYSGDHGGDNKRQFYHVQVSITGSKPEHLGKWRFWF